MPQCYVETCGNYYEKTRGAKDIIYHMLPGDAMLAEKWIRACGKKQSKLPYYARVCSEHFSEKCYQRDLQHELLGLPLRRKLKPGAIPDKNLPKHLKQKVKDTIIAIKTEKTSENKKPPPSNADKVMLKNKNCPNMNPISNNAVAKKKMSNIPRAEPKPTISTEPTRPSSKMIIIDSSPEISEIEILAQNTILPNIHRSSTKIFDFKLPETANKHSFETDVLKEKEDKDRSSKINNKLNRLPMRSSFRIAKKKSIESLSDSFTEKINTKSQSSGKPEKFTDKLKFMAKLQLKFERKENFVALPRYDLEASLDKMMKRECFANSEASYERDVQHELLGLPTRCRLKRGAIPDQNLPNDFLKEEKQPESAIAILLAVGLVPTNKSSSNIGGLPQDLNKMQIMEDVREGCDANPPSSPGHAEERHGEIQLEKSVKTEDVAENGIDDGEKKEGTLETKEVSVKEEQDDKKSEEEVEDKQEENSSGRSSASENNNKRKLENEQSPIKRLKTEIEDNFLARDKIMNEFVEVTECNTLEQIQSFSDQILSEIKALNEMAKEKEREWNQLLHLKKLKEELLIRLQRKRQVLIINDSDLNEYQPETNGQQSLLKCNQKVNMLRELRAANLEKLKQRSNMFQNAYKQKPMLDVQSIIADYRQRHPETVPRRGRRIRHSQSDGKTSILGFSGGSLTIGQKSAMENSDLGLLPNAFNGSQDDSQSSSMLQNSWYRPGEDIKSYKDMLLQFTKLSQAEKSELQMQLQNSTKPPPPYPEVTVHPVTSTSSVAPANSLLHGILTKAPIRQNNANGNTTTAVNGGKTSFSPTLARLLTAPEKTTANQITSTPTMMSGNLLNSGNMSLTEIFSGSKVRNEITITPVGSQYEAPTKRESTEEESEDQTDRLVIDEALESSNSRNKEDNRSEDGEDVPQCQGCNQKAAQFVCAGCGNQWYCSRDCQVAAWDEHSEVCSG